MPLSTAAPMDQRGGMHIEAREERRVDLQEALRYRRLVIIGDPGSGKTTFLRRIGNALATGRLEASRAVVVPDVEIQTTPEQRRSFSDRLLSFFGIETPKPERETRHAQTEQPFPVFIRVADLAEHIRKCSRQRDYDGPTSRTSAGWIGDYLKARSRANNQGLAADFFPRLLDDGNCLLMLDGLDEAAGGRERAAIARLFEEATHTYAKCRFIVTTRPLAYQGQATLDGFQPARIEALDEDRSCHVSGPLVQGAVSAQPGAGGTALG